jgi:sigma-B regulation protein RsbU (phosphoserine phosphatase)
VTETDPGDAAGVDPERRGADLRGVPESLDSSPPSRAPSSAPRLDGYDIAGWSLPEGAAGGDFFEFHDLEGDRLAVMAGDVTGHGPAAARIAEQCRALLHAVLLQTVEPAQVITQLNQLLCARDLDERIVTGFFGVLQAAENRIEYVSAGQGPLLFSSYAKGTIDELEIQGFPLGLSPTLTFGPPGGVVLAPGDFLALITDGFFEWFNGRGECYGVERMKAQILRDRDQPAAAIIARLHASVLEFADGSPQPDDLTAVLIKRLH